jgi:MFS family permease
MLIKIVGWYGTALLITFAAVQTMWGKMFKYYPLKATHLVTLAIFELGSLVCAVTPTSKGLIAGRAIAGVGAAGLCTGTFTIIGYTVEPTLQPTFMGLMGATYACACFIGPIIGGAFTTEVTWRWCFYLNLPVGGLAAFIIVFFLKSPPYHQPPKVSFVHKMSQMDFSGVILCIGFFVCYVLALQWGGVEKSWSNSDVIGTFVGFGVLAILFVINEWWLGERASVVPRIMKNRRVLWCNVVVTLNSAGFFVLIYYLPIYFQSVRGTSAITSAVHNLPFLIGGLTSMVSGAALSATNQFIPFMAIGAALSAVGGGLIYTFEVDTPTGNWIGYQIIAGASTGFISQSPIMASTAIADMSDMSTVSAMCLFFQHVGGSLAVPAAESIFNNLLYKSLPQYAPGVDARTIATLGASDFRQYVTPEQLPGVLQAYMHGLKGVFALATALLAASVPFVFFPKWEKLRAEQKIPLAQAPAAANDEEKVQQ